MFVNNFRARKYDLVGFTSVQVDHQNTQKMSFQNIAIKFHLQRLLPKLGYMLIYSCIVYLKNLIRLKALLQFCSKVWAIIEDRLIESNDKMIFSHISCIWWTLHAEIAL